MKMLANLLVSDFAWLRSKCCLRNESRTKFSVSIGSLGALIGRDFNYSIVNQNGDFSAIWCRPGRSCLTFGLRSTRSQKSYNDDLTPRVRLGSPVLEVCFTRRDDRRTVFLSGFDKASSTFSNNG